MLENKEISLMFTDTHGMMERSSMTIDDVFSYSVTQVIIDDDEIEPLFVAEFQRCVDWPKWKEAIQAELDSLAKRQIFGPVVICPPNVKPVGHKESLFERGMRNMKSCAIKLNLWRNDFLNALELTTRRYILP